MAAQTLYGLGSGLGQDYRLLRQSDKDRREFDEETASLLKWVERTNPRRGRWPAKERYEAHLASQDALTQQALALEAQGLQDPDAIGSIDTPPRIPGSRAQEGYYDILGRGSRQAKDIMTGKVHSLPEPGSAFYDDRPSLDTPYWVGDDAVATSAISGNPITARGREVSGEKPDVREGIKKLRKIQDDKDSKTSWWQKALDTIGGGIGQAVDKVGPAMSGLAESGALGHAFRQASILAGGLGGSLTGDESAKLIQAGQLGYKKSLSDRDRLLNEMQIARLKSGDDNAEFDAKIRGASKPYELAEAVWNRYPGPQNKDDRDSALRELGGQWSGAVLSSTENTLQKLDESLTGDIEDVTKQESALKAAGISPEVAKEWADLIEQGGIDQVRENVAKLRQILEGDARRWTDFGGIGPKDARTFDRVRKDHQEIVKRFMDDPLTITQRVNL